VPSRTRRLLPLVLATTATQASIVVLAPLLVEIARDLGGSVSAVGAARSVLAGTAVAVSLAIGPLIDRIGVRPLIEARYVFLCCRHRRPGDGRRTTRSVPVSWQVRCTPRARGRRSVCGTVKSRRCACSGAGRIGGNARRRLARTDSPTRLGTRPWRVPLLTDALASSECAIVAEHPAGDHRIGPPTVTSGRKQYRRHRPRGRSLPAPTDRAAAGTARDCSGHKAIMSGRPDQRPTESRTTRSASSRSPCASASRPAARA